MGILQEYAQIEKMAQGLDRHCNHPYVTHKPELRANQFYTSYEHPIQCDVCHAVWDCEHTEYEMEGHMKICLDCGEVEYPEVDVDLQVKYAG